MSQRKVLRFSREAAEEIARQVLAAYNAIPKRGAETGGLLLGRDSDGEHQIRDCVPIACSHRFGPSFLLDGNDRKAFEESLSACGGDRPEALPVAGIFRSNTRGPAAPDQRDGELLAAYFSRRPVLFLLLQPARNQSIQAYLWSWTGEDLQAVAGGIEFPFADGFAMPVQEVGAPSGPAGPAPAQPLIPQPPPAAPPPEVEDTEAPPPPSPVESSERAPGPPRLNWTEPPREQSSRRRMLAAAAILLAASGAYLGFRAAQPQLHFGQPARTPAAPPAKAVEPPAPPPSPPIVHAPAQEPPAAPPEPAQPEAKTEGRADRADPDPKTSVRKTLEEWAAAQRSGEPREVADFYAPRVNRYLGRRDLSQTNVADEVAAFIGAHGIPVIFRLSDVRIESLGDGGATATFRKHWQTRGARMHAGEEEVRVSLVRRGGEWKIAAEDELRVFWTHALR